ncbi:CDP-glycerol glycerophosphotransferase family protein [Mixta hanseatica]|uniref:CDP-glycerol glycerophosphotransferase family protein n=1 Tax=Mixta hanseatica TaxID=2872648 RepID=A0ABY4R7B6_9GAMM|nr:CDP-glycerol glycerophosphotransferase family protein [Mixta hanseatica]UQY42862.1 CDP-glycerol glycerophosphotransferase family protein [Mixta hanseatica]
MFKKSLIRMSKKILSCLIYLIPKDKEKIIFKSRPDFSGNAKALSDYIQKNHKNYKIVWFVEAQNYTATSGIRLFKAGTLSAIWQYATAKYIVTTHNEMIGTKSGNQTYISLWHGMPLKKICYLGEFDHQGMEDYSSYRIATSEVMRAIIAACFREKANNVYITGQPRNDFLYDKTLAKERFEFLLSGKTRVFYVPTFRENQEANMYSDGDSIKNNNFLRVQDFDLYALDRFLQQNNCQLFIKLHPYEENTYLDLQLSENIRIIKSEELRSNDLDINHLLAHMDMLITDYSSVYFDYMLLDKPICFLTPDLDAYSKSRGGFALEPVDYWMPGYHCSTQRELLNEIETLLAGNDRYAGHRSCVNAIINLFKDDRNSERVFKQFF